VAELYALDSERFTADPRGVAKLAYDADLSWRCSQR
jgi:hypothetical protein